MRSEPARVRTSIFNIFNLGKEFFKYKTMSKIQGTTKICDIYRRHPKAIDYLLELGICECHGMASLANTIESEARKRGLDVEKVLKELNERA